MATKHAAAWSAREYLRALGEMLRREIDRRRRRGEYDVPQTVVSEVSPNDWRLPSEVTE